MLETIVQNLELNYIELYVVTKLIHHHNHRLYNYNYRLHNYNYRLQLYKFVMATNN